MEATGSSGVASFSLSCSTVESVEMAVVNVEPEEGRIVRTMACCGVFSESSMAVVWCGVVRVMYECDETFFFFVELR